MSLTRHRQSSTFAEIMKPTFIPSVLTTAIWTLHSFGLFGKKLFPEALGTSWVQWGIGIVVAILIPIGVLLGLKLINEENKKIGCLLVLFSAAPLALNLGLWQVTSYALNRAEIHLQASLNTDTELLSSLTDEALEGETIAIRKTAAATLYAQSAILPIWKNENGILERYDLEFEELAPWEERVDLIAEMKRIRTFIQYQTKQMLILSLSQMGAFCIIFTIGLSLYSLKKTRAKSSR